jgi:DNA modification methylase
LSQIDDQNKNNNEFDGSTEEEKDTQRLNDLDGATWLQWSKSIWRFKKPVVENYGHPAIFPEFVAERLIKIFTREQNLVLDPMAGVGTTLFVAKTLHRNAIGIELSPKYCEIVKSRLKQQVFPKHLTEELIQKAPVRSPIREENTNFHKIICDDARNLLAHVSRNTIDFCLTSPPYWIGLHGVNGKYTGQTQKEWKVYSDSEKDYGNIQDYQKFVDELKSLFSNVFEVLREGKYCVVIIQDSRRGSEVYPLHMDFCCAMKSIGYSYQDSIIWEHPTYTTRPLGYPTTFVISRVHDFIMVFRKPKR